MNKILITAILIQATCILFIQGCTLQGQRGTCKPVRDCPVLLERLKPKHRDSDPFIKKYILDAHRACSQQQNSGLEKLILLCCPSSTTSNNNRGSINRGSTSSRPSVSSSPSSGGCETLADDQDRIVEASIGAWPWMVLIGSDGRNGKEFFCGGILISERHVLSAAHCAYSKFQRTPFVRVGEYDLSTETDCDGIQCVPFGKMQEILLDSIITHPRYNQNFPECNDIAVIKLRSSAVEDGRYVQHVRLPNNLRNDVGASFDLLHANLHWGYVAGWGKNKNRNRNGSNVLMQARLCHGSVDRCEKSIGGRTSCQEKESVFCAGDCSNGPCKDTCIGDSGGPIMMRDKLEWYVVGVRSVGPSICGSERILGLYTNVNHFIDWIRKNML